MNTPISFPTAKSLKEKEFDYHGWSDMDTVEKWSKGDRKHHVLPTIAEVVMWLYENHKIWISASKNKYDKFQIIFGLRGKNSFIKGITDGDIEYNKVEYYDSPTEAYEAAIEYALKNLI